MWCWLQESICSCGDVVPSTDNAESFRPPNEAALFRTLGALLTIHNLNLMGAKMDQKPATNTTNDEDDGFVDDNVPLRGIRRTPDTLDFNRKRKYASVKFQLPEEQKLSSSDDSTLTEIIEECEYDSDIGKFKCKDDDAIENEDDSEGNLSSTSSMVDHYLEVEHLNNLNSPPKNEINKNSLDMNNIVDDDSHYKIVMKRIEFFESHGEKEKCEKLTNIHIPSREEQILSKILLAIFILTVTLLIIFPLPNY